jgi:hypothetical protein
MSTYPLVKFAFEVDWGGKNRIPGSNRLKC